MKRKIYTIPVFLVLIAVILYLNNANITSALDVFNTKRGANVTVTTNENAYIGIIYNRQYNVYKGDSFSFEIQNNLPYVISYALYMDGSPISAYGPSAFILQPNGDNTTISVQTITSIEPGEYDLKGTVIADFDKGSGSVDFDFKVVIETPIEEIQALLAVENFEKAPFDTLDDIEKAEELLITALSEIEKVIDESVKMNLQARTEAHKLIIEKKKLELNELNLNDQKEETGKEAVDTSLTSGE